MTKNRVVYISFFGKITKRAYLKFPYIVNFSLLHLPRNHISYSGIQLTLTIPLYISDAIGKAISGHEILIS